MKHEKLGQVPTLGFLLNPVAGMGGAVGLKGTDGTATLKEALRRGAKPVSPKRGYEFLSKLASHGKHFALLVPPGPMGGDIAEGAGLDYQSVGRVGPRTTGRDTIRISSLMKKRNVKLIVFCGGDGTARDVFKGVDSEMPVLGVPAGVKVYSSVFAINPNAAVEIAIQFLERTLPTRQGELLDIDEKKYRDNQLSVQLLGNLTTPDSGVLMQNMKMPTKAFEGEELEAIAEYVKEETQPKIIYVLGPGTTVQRIGETLGVKKNVLGVDVVRGDGTVLGNDVDEAALLKIVIPGQTKIIVSPIGGQGFLFGRGNQQISPKVLRKIGLENLIIVASRTKLTSLVPRRLLVDTGDSELDDQLRDYRRVITGYMEEMIVKVE